MKNFHGGITREIPDHDSCQCPKAVILIFLYSLCIEKISIAALSFKWVRRRVGKKRSCVSWHRELTKENTNPHKLFFIELGQSGFNQFKFRGPLTLWLKVGGGLFLKKKKKKKKKNLQKSLDGCYVLFWWDPVFKRWKGILKVLLTPTWN